MNRLSRREILEGLKRQGIIGLSRIKSECRRYESREFSLMNSRLKNKT